MVSAKANALLIRVGDCLNMVRMASNEKEISHGRVSWQSRLRSCGFGDAGFIEWLHSQPRHLSNVSILIDSECKNIQTLSACAGVHRDLVPLSAPQAQRSLT